MHTPYTPYSTHTWVGQRGARCHATAPNNKGGQALNAQLTVQHQIASPLDRRAPVAVCAERSLSACKLRLALRQTADCGRRQAQQEEAQQWQHPLELCCCAEVPVLLRHVGGARFLCCCWCCCCLETATTSTRRATTCSCLHGSHLCLAGLRDSASTTPTQALCACCCGSFAATGALPRPWKLSDHAVLLKIERKKGYRVQNVHESR